MSKNIYVISVGCGSRDYLTLKAIETAKKVDFLVGAKRFKGVFSNKKYITADDLIRDTIRILENEKEKIAGVVVSGDAGFFSLAKIIYAKFKNRIIEVVPGISSMQLGMAKLLKTYERVEFLSLHGRDISLDEFNKRIDFCIEHRKSLYILNDNNNRFFEFLSKSRRIFSHFDVYVLNNLGLPDESIYKLEPKDELKGIKLGLYAIYLEVKGE